MHPATLGPILKAMDFSEMVLLDPETACPMNPKLSFLGAPMLPPRAWSAGLAGDLTTQTKPQKLHKQVTPDKLVKCAVDVPVDDPAADVSVDDQGWQTMFAHILADDVPDGVPAADSSVDDASVGVSVDDQGWPTIVGNFLHVDAKEEPTKQHEGTMMMKTCQPSDPLTQMCGLDSCTTMV